MSLSAGAASPSWRLRDGPGRTVACARAVSFLLGAVLLLGSGEPLLAQTREELRAAVRGSGRSRPPSSPCRTPGSTVTSARSRSSSTTAPSYDDRLPDGDAELRGPHPRRPPLLRDARRRVRLSRRLHELRVQDERRHRLPPLRTQRRRGHRQAGRQRGARSLRQPVPPQGLDRHGRRVPVPAAALLRDAGRPGLPADARTSSRTRWATSGSPRPATRSGTSPTTTCWAQDGAHWSYLLDSDASFFYGADWRDNGDGTFTAARVKERYSALDLYLMGLLPKEKVPPLLLLRNPAVDRHRINREGEVVTATGTSEIPVDQLIAEMGPRRPDWHALAEGVPARLRLPDEARHRAERGGPRGRRAGPARLRGALLRPHARRRLGGHDARGDAQPSPRRAPGPREGARLARRAAGPRRELVGLGGDAPAGHGRGGVGARDGGGGRARVASAGSRGCRQAQPESLDFRARRASALAPATLTAADRSARVAALLGRQNADGGFGAGTDFASDALDTALALRALQALDHPEDARVQRAVSALDGLGEPRRRLAGRRRRRDVHRRDRRGPARAAGLERGPRIGGPPRARVSRRSWPGRTPTAASAAARARPTPRRSPSRCCSGRGRRPTSSSR